MSLEYREGQAPIKIDIDEGVHERLDVFVASVTKYSENVSKAIEAAKARLLNATNKSDTSIARHANGLFNGDGLNRNLPYLEKWVWGCARIRDSFSSGAPVIVKNRQQYSEDDSFGSKLFEFTVTDNGRDTSFDYPTSVGRDLLDNQIKAFGWSNALSNGNEIVLIAPARVTTQSTPL